MARDELSADEARGLTNRGERQVEHRASEAADRRKRVRAKAIRVGQQRGRQMVLDFEQEVRAVAARGLREASLGAQSWEPDPTGEGLTTQRDLVRSAMSKRGFTVSPATIRGGTPEDSNDIRHFTLTVEW